MAKSVIPITFIIICLCLVSASQPLSAQAGRLGSIKYLDDMEQGMTYNEVVDILGRPKNTEVMSGFIVARWKLQEPWVGYIPYDFLFTHEDSILVHWEKNEKDYAAQQARWKLIAESLQELETATASGSSGGDVPVQNDPQLMQQFAGSYYSFSAVGGGQTGGTERRVILCADGTFRQSQETGYSGDAGTSGAWGSASQGGGAGKWSIQGNLQNGTLSTTDNNGSTTNYQYSSCGNGCYMFGNNKFAYEGPSGC